MTDFKQLVAWIKANPDKATFGVPCNGTIPHFTGSQLEKVLGISMTRVSYRGSAPIINDLIGGHLPFCITTLSDAITQHRAGGISIVAVTSPDAFALPARRADAERDRRRSGGRRLVRHVAASRQSAGFCEEAERCGRRDPGEAGREGEAAAITLIPVGSTPEDLTQVARCRHRVLAADRESDRLQDHELGYPTPRRRRINRPSRKRASHSSLPQGFRPQRHGAASPASTADTLARLSATIAGQYPSVRAMVLARGNCILHEYYAADHSPEVQWPLRSVTKSVLSILVGIAIDKGLLRLDQSCPNWLPKRQRGPLIRARPISRCATS